jgi:hypothetical protein
MEMKPVIHEVEMSPPAFGEKVTVYLITEKQHTVTELVN